MSLPQLEDLHEEYLSTLPEEKHLDYLLTSSVFLQKNDLNGWLQTFKPPSEISPSKKRPRGAQDAATFNHSLKTLTCEECQGETIEDITEGHTVCLKCGLIQREAIYRPDSKVHFSSRLSLGATIVIWIRVNIVGIYALIARIVGVTLVFSSKTGRPEWISRMARNRKRRAPLLPDRLLSKSVDEPCRRNETDDYPRRVTCLDILRERPQATSRQSENTSVRGQARNQSNRAAKTTPAARGNDSRDRIRKKLKLARPERRPFVEV